MYPALQARFQLHLMLHLILHSDPVRPPLHTPSLRESAKRLPAAFPLRKAPGPSRHRPCGSPRSSSPPLGSLGCAQTGWLHQDCGIPLFSAQPHFGMAGEAADGRVASRCMRVLANQDVEISGPRPVWHHLAQNEEVPGALGGPDEYRPQKRINGPARSYSCEHRGYSLSRGGPFQIPDPDRYQLVV